MEPSDSSKRDNGRSGSGIDWHAQLVEHRPWLRAVIAARVGDSESVDDVFQEVALAAIEERSPIGDVEKVAAWLYRVAVVQAIRHRRRRVRQRRRDTAAAWRTNQATNHDDDIPINWLLSRERRQMVRDALNELPGRDAEILMLKYFENWSYRQLAERLGLSEKAIDNRLYRARRRLRAQLSNISNEAS